MHTISIIFGLVTLLCFGMACYFKDEVWTFVGIIMTLGFMITLAAVPIKTTVNYENIPTEHIFQISDDVFIVRDRDQIVEIKDLEIYKAVKNGTPIAWEQKVRVTFFDNLEYPVKLAIDPKHIGK